MRIFNINFRGHWPVPHGLVIAANNEEQAKEMAVQVLEEEGLDPETMDVSEVIVADEPQIIFFESGNY